MGTRYIAIFSRKHHVAELRFCIRVPKVTLAEVRSLCIIIRKTQIQGGADWLVLRGFQLFLRQGFLMGCLEETLAHFFDFDDSDGHHFGEAIDRV